MLWKLAYLMLCHSIRLLALLARGDAAKYLEILVLLTTGGNFNLAIDTTVDEYCSSVAWSTWIADVRRLLRTTEGSGGDADSTYGLSDRAGLGGADGPSASR